ncbi:hypothetical protein LSTR_LSTR015758 [Laodelphax striatellus]|uniref:Uncharacterized protein n=1 Tax=Laodelphax striatellus TaxID=195883 RepID=A0A482X9L0_LAOST|nr:hypothetical protein LSTR_LSTR015758 [Laodelphax striatellus]
MRNFRLSAAVLLCAIYRVSCEDYEYDDEISAPAPVQKAAPPPPRGLSALQRSARGPVIGRPQPKSLTKSTTSTTTPEPPPGDEYDDEQLVDEEEAQGGSEEQTTTEAAKKGTVLKGGVVRPFRSNTDLLETLKRRRAQVGQHGQVVSTTHAPPTPSTEASKSFKNNASGRRNKIADQTGSNSNLKSSTTNASGASASSGSGRRFSPRGQRPEASSQEPTSSEETQTARSSRLFAGRGRRF